MEDPKPDHDMRPRYKKIEKVLIQAEEMANKFVAGSCPRDLHPEISMPVARLLARVRLALAELRLMQVCVQYAHTHTYTPWHTNMQGHKRLFAHTAQV